MKENNKPRILFIIDDPVLLKSFEFSFTKGKPANSVSADFRSLYDKGDSSDVKKTTYEAVVVIDGHRPNGLETAEELQSDPSAKILIAARDSSSANKETPILIFGVFPGRAAFKDLCAKDENIIMKDSTEVSLITPAVIANEISRALSGRARN